MSAVQFAHPCGGSSVYAQQNRHVQSQHVVFYIILECVNVKDLFFKRARADLNDTPCGWMNIFFFFLNGWMENPDISLCLSGGWNLSLRSMCPHERIEWTVGYVVKGSQKKKKKMEIFFFSSFGGRFILFYGERESLLVCFDCGHQLDNPS